MLTTIDAALFSIVIEQCVPAGGAALERRVPLNTEPAAVQKGFPALFMWDFEMSHSSLMCCAIQPALGRLRLNPVPGRHLGILSIAVSLENINALAEIQPHASVKTRGIVDVCRYVCTYLFIGVYV